MMIITVRENGYNALFIFERVEYLLCSSKGRCEGYRRSWLGSVFLCTRNQGVVKAYEKQTNQHQEVKHDFFIAAL